MPHHHKIAPPKTTSLFSSKNISRGLHDTNRLIVPIMATADRADIVLGQGATTLRVPDAISRLSQSRG